MHSTLLGSTNPVERPALAVNQRKYTDELAVNLVSHGVRKARQGEAADWWNTRGCARPPRPCFRCFENHLKCSLDIMYEVVPQAVAAVVVPRSGVGELGLGFSEEYELHDVL
jgi:hypothetical protein